MGIQRPEWHKMRVGDWTCDELGQEGEEQGVRQDVIFRTRIPRDVSESPEPSRVPSESVWLVRVLIERATKLVGHCSLLIW